MIDKEKLITEVNDFIKRRFQKDCDWMNGNCYWFAMILRWRFPEELGVYYEPVAGHFYAGTEDETLFFDWEGSYMAEELKVKPILLYEIAEEDEIWYSRINRDCMA